MFNYVSVSRGSRGRGDEGVGGGFPEAARHSQQELKGTRSRQDQPGRGQEQPGAAGSSQAKARSSQEIKKGSGEA